eukprot:1176021-Prorocentrum_minimum.AAC.1
MERLQAAITEHQTTIEMFHLGVRNPNYSSHSNHPNHPNHPNQKGEFQRSNACNASSNAGGNAGGSGSFPPARRENPGNPAAPQAGFMGEWFEGYSYDTVPGSYNESGKGVTSPPSRAPPAGPSLATLELLKTPPPRVGVYRRY